MLDFERICFDKKAVIDDYFFKYGEGSCQHSFVSSFLRENKYGDMLCEKNKYLYVLRSGKCTSEESAYLFPMGETSDMRRMYNAIERILIDAHERGTAVRFDSVTEKAKDIILKLFPDIFKAEYKRNLSEYCYEYNKFLNLPGRKLYQKRHDAKRFTEIYDGRYKIERISSEHIEDIKLFQKKWFEEKYSASKDVELKIENEAISVALNNFEKLGMSGIVLYIDGELKGYLCGAPASESVYDFIFEKADVNIMHIYKILNIEMTRLCCDGYKYINLEEDLGVPGLRGYKTAYCPDYMIKKYVLTEVRKFE